jgi:hypothetical protein
MSDEELQKVLDELGGAEAAQKALFELASEKRDQKARAKICRIYADALARTGRLLWVHGSLLGSDRAEKKSPFGFGNDDVVGLAAVCQVGGELARGAIDLLKADNPYGALALVRQLVEVEYLAAAFAEEDAIAGEWLRANRGARLNFWSPGELRKRSGGKFLSDDYWDHCDRGGHPTREGLYLLPGQGGIPPAFHWADLAGHLYSIWSSVVRAVDARGELFAGDPQAAFPDVAKATSSWLEKDKLTLVLRAMHGRVRRSPDGDNAS